MKKAYYEIRNGLPVNADIMSAIDGLEYIGYDVKPYTIENVLSGKMDLLARNNIFVGGLDCMSLLFKQIGKSPNPIDFPDEISSLVKRKLNVMSIEEAIETFRETNVPLFIKPVKTKLFDGILIEKEEYLNYFKGFEGEQVITSEKMDIYSEYRIYIYKNEIIYSANYSGNFEVLPDFDYIREIINAYCSAPIAYTIDVAICQDGINDIVELNDFWSIGNYGVNSWVYAQMLVDRYEQIINKKIQ